VKAVILAGGLGSRMGKLCESIPKALVKICDKPIILHQIEILKREGIKEFILVTGHLSEKIEEFLGDGKDFGVNISYYCEDKPLGTGGALFRIDLKEDFLFCNGDLVFDVDLSSMIEFHKKNKALITLFVHPNNHPQDSTSFEIDQKGKVIGFYKKNEKPTYYPNLCNAGIQIVSHTLFNKKVVGEKIDFDTEVLTEAIMTEKVYAYKSPEYVRDAGTPERVSEIEKDLFSGVVSRKNIRQLQKAIFLDRDGTINVHKGYICTPEQIELIDGVAEAIVDFHRLGYLVIIITNQPVISRGICTYKQLKNVHSYLESLLSKKGAYVDSIYFCPHHPDSGFEGEIESLKIACNCRKPKPGLIFEAQKDFNIDLSKSFMVGDSAVDVEAAKAAGCTPVLLSQSEDNSDVMCCKNLFDFSQGLKDKFN